MKLLLFLSGVLCVSAVQHEDLAIVGCSDSDGEDMYALDGEELVYADFKKKEQVDAQPPFVDHVSMPGGYEQAVANQQICKTNLNVLREAEKDIPLKRVPPSNLMIYTRDPVEVDLKNTLVCYVSGFYPAPVKVNWTKNGLKVTEGTRINVPLPSEDGSSFTQISRLDFTPQLGDIYSCSVEHVALKDPQTRIWDVDSSKTEPSVGPAVFCGVGLTVGLLGVAVGTFFLIKGNECS